MITSIKYLPADVINQIASHLNIDETIKLSKTCRHFSKFFNSLDYIKNAKDLKIELHRNMTLQELEKKVTGTLNGQLFKRLLNSPEEVEKTLKEKRNFFELVDYEGNTYLHYRVQRGQPASIFEIFDRHNIKLDLNAINSNGHTPLVSLLLSERRGYLTKDHLVQTVSVLLERGANADFLLNDRFVFPTERHKAYCRELKPTDQEYLKEISEDEVKERLEDLFNKIMSSRNFGDVSVHEQIITLIKETPIKLMNNHYTVNIKGPLGQPMQLPIRLWHLVVQSNNVTALRLINLKNPNFFNLQGRLEMAFNTCVRFSFEEFFFTFYEQTKTNTFFQAIADTFVTACKNYKIFEFFLTNAPNNFYEAVKKYYPDFDNDSLNLKEKIISLVSSELCLNAQLILLKEYVKRKKSI